MKRLLWLISVTILVAGCSGGKSFNEALNSISAESMKEFTKEISSDEFMGRMPFTEGETKSIAFLEEKLKEIKFEPLFGDSYLQKVPMVKIVSTLTTPISITTKGRSEVLSQEEVSVNSPKPVNSIDLKDVEMVFCGFGIVAPEYGWNDFEGMNIQGKIAVVLINDPGLYVEPEDKSLFKGKELTYYGRWRYKYEEAARQGAAGVLIIHEDYGAGYNWRVASRGASTGRLFINDEALMDNCSVTGWLEGGYAERLFKAEGYSLKELKNAACVKGFKGFAMKSKISIALENTMEENESYNVAGILKGRVKPEEAVVFTAHWDHFGVVPSAAIDGDSIFNGAVDNGTTMAWAYEVATAFSSLKKRPDRSVILLFPTAEEQGLLGSHFFVNNPPIPTSNMLACFNNDMMEPRGRMNDLMLIGYGYSPKLDSLLTALAQKQGRYVTGDPDSHRGLFFRSDHFPFHHAGVPSIWAMGCYDSREKGKEWGRAAWYKFVNEVYHTPLDNYNPDWDWSGVVEDTQITFEAAYEILNGK